VSKGGDDGAELHMIGDGSPRRVAGNSRNARSYSWEAFDSLTSSGSGGSLREIGGDKLYSQWGVSTLS